MAKLPIIKKGFHGGMDFQPDVKVGSSLFLYVYFAAIAIAFIVLILRLMHLTIVKGAYYRGLAEGNRLREIIIEPQRGTLIDRKGIVITENQAANLHSEGMRLTSLRNYINGEALAPIVGYRQLADNNDIKNDNCLNKLQLGDKTGKRGIEKLYDCELRGQNGKKLVEVDAHGKFLKTVTVIPPQDGKTIQLAVDSVLQKKAYELLEGKRAAVVAIKPQTGEIVLMVSSPSFDPSDFENGNADKITEYFNGEDRPMFNRSAEGTYPPGSTFKLVVAAAALEEKTITEDETILDTGKITAGPIEFGNWYFLQYGRTEGAVDMVKAIQRSNDIYFYKVGERLGSGKIRAWAEKFGYGKSSGLGLSESEGVLPSEFWKEETLKEQWYLGDTYNYSIGQGYILATPFQVTRATAAIANNGLLCKPKLLKSLQPECQKIPISQKTLDIIKEGMFRACATGGAAWPLFDFSVNNSKGQSVPLPLACKTGTAESFTETGKPHAWLTAMAPAKDPEITVTVLVEKSGQGSDQAGPIVRDILKAYFERKE